MKLHHLHDLQTATEVTCTRPLTATRLRGTGRTLGLDNGNAYANAAASWSIAARKSMTVPAFHDRWPLCSTT